MGVGQEEDEGSAEFKSYGAAAARQLRGSCEACPPSPNARSVDALELSADALADPDLGDVVVAHALLEELTDPAAQCTPPAAKRAGPMPMSWAVAYRWVQRVGQGGARAGAQGTGYRATERRQGG